jgi:uncharacterized protein (TIGR03437 family)
MMSKQYPSFFLGVAILTIASAYAQSPNVFCVTSAKPLILRSEGLAERVGEIVYDCSGQPGTQVTANLTISLNVNITNRLSSGNTLTGIILTIDTGSGPQAQPILPVLMSPGALVFNGLSFTLSQRGTAQLVVADIRANPTQAGANVPLLAFLGVSHTSLALTSATVNVGNPQRGLFSSLSSRIVCTQAGSPLPDTISFSNLVTGHTEFASTRITEGFADALQPRGGYANLNADSGERIIVRYSGFPQGARLFVPDFIAGSDAVQPTAGGDFGLPASGGAFAASASGSLLLARVDGSDVNGARGGVVFNPAIFAEGTVRFDSVSELQMVNGTAQVVYEVLDSDPSRIESAQFPTFLGLAPSGSGVASATNESVALAPISNVSIATTTDPLPRFIPIAPLPDCTIVGDCGASFFPILTIQNTPFQFRASGTGFDLNYIYIRNTGSGVLQWSVSAVFPLGSPTGWLTFTPPSGLNNATVRVDANAAKLQPGTYTATIIVDGGPLATVQTIPVTFTVGPALPSPPPPQAAIQVMSVVNGASFLAAPVVPGSLVSVMGAGFTGKSVGVTFDGKPGSVLFNNDTQINVLTPSDLTPNNSKMVVTVDGVSSAPITVNVAQFAPAIFKGAVLNQDWTVNSANNAATAGSVVQIYATGLSGTGTIKGRIGDRVIVPLYAGPAPGFPGVQQINLQVPTDMAAMTADLFICGATADKLDSPVCSVAAPLAVK